MRHLADRPNRIRIVDLNALAQGHGGAGDIVALTQALGSLGFTQSDAPDAGIDSTRAPAMRGSR